MSKLKIYEDISDRIKSCTKCDLNCGSGDSYVVGSGNLNANIMFVAEAPGKTEVEKSQPMALPGLTGKTFERVLKRLGLQRDDVFATNTIACRPPKNRDPLPWELEACKSNLAAQINLVQPKLVVTFGRLAAQVFVNDIKITKEHGKLHRSDFFNIDIYPLFHPSYVHAYASLKNRKAFDNDVFKLRKIIYGINYRESGNFDTIADIGASSCTERSTGA